MKKHPTKKEKRRILSFLKDFEWAFGLQTYDKTVKFLEKNLENYAAEIEIQDDYQRIIISIYPSFFDRDLKTQREYLLHEFCHYLTDPIATVAWEMSHGKLKTDKDRKFENEKSTSRIANIIDQLLTGDLKFAKKAYADYLKK